MSTTIKAIEATLQTNNGDPKEIGPINNEVVAIGTTTTKTTIGVIKTTTKVIGMEVTTIGATITIKAGGTTMETKATGGKTFKSPQCTNN